MQCIGYFGLLTIIWKVGVHTFLIYNEGENFPRQLSCSYGKMSH